MDIEGNLKNLKIILPEPKDPVGAYVAVKKTGNICFMSHFYTLKSKFHP